MEGWVTTTAEADTYYGQDYQFGDAWLELTEAKKEAALISSYRKIYNSASVVVPAYTETIEPTILETLKAGQLEMVKMLVVLGEGGIRREAALSQGVVSAGIVKESYNHNYASGLPGSILDILKDFKTTVGGVFLVNTNYYRR